MWCKKQLHIVYEFSNNITSDGRCKACRNASRQAFDCKSGRKYRRFIRDLRTRIVEKTEKIAQLERELEYAQKISY